MAGESIVYDYYVSDEIRQTMSIVFSHLIYRHSWL